MRTWAYSAFIRTFKTFCEALVSIVGIGKTFFDVDWSYALDASAFAAFLCFLTTLKGLPEVDETKEETEE